MSSPFEFRLRVRYGECDAQQVVFNARYADYADLAVTEYLRCLFGGVKALLAQDLDTQVVRFAIDWRAPARFDDVVVLQITPAKVGNTSFSLHIRYAQAQDDKALAQAELVYVMVHAQSHQKVILSDEFKRRLAEGAPGVRVDQASCFEAKT